MEQEFHEEISAQFLLVQLVTMSRRPGTSSQGSSGRWRIGVAAKQGVVAEPFLNGFVGDTRF
jgi:hypothetical protein